MDQQCWQEAEGERRPLHSEKLPHKREINWDRKGPLGNQRRMQQMVCGRQDSVRAVCMVKITALCIPA